MATGSAGMRNNVLWIGLVMATCLAAGWWLGSVGQRESNGSTSQRLDAVEARIGAGSDDRVELRSGRASNRAGAAGIGTVGPPPLPDPVADAKALGAAIVSFDRRLQVESRDPAWARKAESTIAEAMLAPGLREFGMPVADQTRCGSTMCRMVFTFDDAGTAADWSDFYPLGIASVLPGVRSYPVTLPDGRVELRMYGFRGEATSRMDARLPEP